MCLSTPSPYSRYLENDGKNDSQLLHANLHWYLYEWTFQRADAEVRWLEDQDITALLAWLWYMMCTRGQSTCFRTPH